LDGATPVSAEHPSFCEAFLFWQNSNLSASVDMHFELVERKNASVLLDNGVVAPGIACQLLDDLFVLLDPATPPAYTSSADLRVELIAP